MKYLVLIFCLLVGAGYFAVDYALKHGPNYIYQGMIHNRMKTNWYIPDYQNNKNLKPDGPKSFNNDLNINNQFWDKFHFGDLYIPLPVKNPLYYVVPKLTYSKKTNSTKFGVSIVNAKEEIINEVYFLPNISFPSYLTDQKIFDLPLVFKPIRAKSDDKIWRDVFEKNLGGDLSKVEEMAYSLYLYNFRSKFFKGKNLKYGVIKDMTKMYMDVEYGNKDYNAEIIFHKRGKLIYSFFITTRKGDTDAEKVRMKFLKDLDYRASTKSLANIIYQEFKSLSYDEQTDHLGMLYLLSAWSHQQDYKEILEYLIFYLERGKGNNLQLKALYNYYYNRYGKMFSKKDVKGLELDSNLKLQKLIQEEASKKVLTPRKPVKNVDINKKIQNDFEKLIEASKKKKRKTKSRKSIRID